MVERDGADRAPLQAAEAVLAAGHLGPAEGDRVGERRERQRQQREVHAAPAQDQHADDRGEHGDERHRQQDRHGDLAAEPVLLGERGGIRADAEPGAVPEGREPGESHEQVESHGRDGEAHHDGGGVHRQPDHGHDERQCDQCERAYPQRAVLRERLAGRHSNFSMRSPSKPRGRNSSTRNISTYIEASPAAGTKWMVMPRTTPTSSAASTTPQKLPSPPITTTTKATVMISAPIAGCTTVIGANSAPPSAAMPTPSITIAAMYGCRRMPRAATMSGRWIPARTTRPKEVRCSSSQMPASTIATTASSSSR